MKLLVDIADVDNLIISAIEETNTLCDNCDGPQSDVWDKVYKALNLLRAKAVLFNETNASERVVGSAPTASAYAQ